MSDFMKNEEIKRLVEAEVARLKIEQKSWDKVWDYIRAIPETKDIDTAWLDKVARNAYFGTSTSQTEVVTKEEMELANVERKLREKLKEMIEKIPAEKLQDVVAYMEDLFAVKVTTEATEKWREREEVTEEEKFFENAKVTVIKMVDVGEAEKIEKAFNEVKDGVADYRSAVKVDVKTVRTVRHDKEKGGDYVMVFNCGDETSAEEAVLLFDRSLRREIGILRVVRTEKSLSVTYVEIGFKIVPEKAYVVRAKTSEISKEFLKKKRRGG